MCLSFRETFSDIALHLNKKIIRYKTYITCNCCMKKLMIIIAQSVTCALSILIDFYFDLRAASYWRYKTKDCIQVCAMHT